MNEKRKELTIDELRKINITAQFVDGVDGNSHRSDQRLTQFCKMFCTDRIIGCALAHFNAMERVLYDEHEVALIVEDDIIVLNISTFEQDLNTILTSNTGWDFISLFCQGICKKGDFNRIFNGSTAAYLVSRKGCEKMLNIKIGYHADIYRQNLNMVSLVETQLFTTRDQRSNIIIGKQDVNFWMNQDVIQIGKLRAQLKHVLLFYLISMSSLLIVKKYNVTKNICIPLLVLPVLIMHFMTHETQYFRCSKLTHVFGMIFPLYVILQQKKLHEQHHNNAVLIMSYFMLLFHIMHHFDH